MCPSIFFFDFLKEQENFVLVKTLDLEVWCCICATHKWWCYLGVRTKLSVTVLHISTRFWTCLCTHFLLKCIKISIQLYDFFPVQLQVKYYNKCLLCFYRNLPLYHAKIFYLFYIYFLFQSAHTDLEDYKTYWVRKLFRN